MHPGSKIHSPAAKSHFGAVYLVKEIIHACPRICDTVQIHLVEFHYIYLLKCRRAVYALIFMILELSSITLN